MTGSLLPDPYRLVLHKCWDDSAADYERWYTLQRYTRTMLGRYKWKTVGYHTEVGLIAIRGNEAWAQKQARHYNISMPKESK